MKLVAKPTVRVEASQRNEAGVAVPLVFRSDAMIDHVSVTTGPKPLKVRLVGATVMAPWTLAPLGSNPRNAYNLQSVLAHSS